MSQPYIKDIPAGKILTSGAILFSGVTPGKVLRMLNHMQVDRAFIATKTDSLSQQSWQSGKQNGLGY